MRSFHRTLGYMAALSLVVAACGGDDGNGGGGPNENDAPVAAFTPSCTNLACTFTDASTDADSVEDIVAWSWDFGDDATSTERSPLHTYAAANTYTVTLTVTDVAGATNSTSQDVTVTVPAENQAPTAAFTFNCLSQDCTFTNGSTDPDAGDVLTYAWDFGDTGTSTEKDPAHTYTVTVADTFTVTLTATDAGGLENTVSHDVVVAPPAVCTAASCDLTLQANATVTVTLTSEGCTADGNTLRILEPVDTTLFTDGCNTPPGTSFDLVGGTANAVSAGTTIVPEVISGSTDLAFPPTLRVKAGTAYPTWTLEFDDGESGEGPTCPGDPTCGGKEPDFDDLIITITATPSP
jgi:PKD repeat protein